MNDTSLIFYTDNSLDAFLMNQCQEHLTRAAEGKRIISVSQKPIDFGYNICVGNIGRSHKSLYTQALAGAREATTDYIALAEHDCLYPGEHFRFVPPTDHKFYYNGNCWIVQWGGAKSGMYSYLRRKTLSNLICNRELFIEAITERLQILEDNEIRKGQLGACEPGGCDTQLAFAKPISCEYSDYQSESFITNNPTLDIRHGGNFSGGRQAKNRCFTVPYWKDFYSVMGVVPPGRWYQEAVINDKPVPVRRQKDTSENRWNKFIRPHVTLTGGSVTDLGCNAGFYSRKFVDLGFKVTGIEREPEFLRHAYYWERQHPKGIRFIESDINDYTPACSHYVLLANVHYWITPGKLAILAHKLRQNALNVILIGRHLPYKGHQSPCGLDFLEQLFDGWVKGAVINGRKHFSVIFTNPKLNALDIERIKLFNTDVKSVLFRTYGELVERCINNETIGKDGSGYYDYLKMRDEQIPGSKCRDALFLRHLDLVGDIINNGIQHPIKIGRIVGNDYCENVITNGDHRLIVAKKLGYKSLICKANHEQRGTK